MTFSETNAPTSTAVPSPLDRRDHPAGPIAPIARRRRRPRFELSVTQLVATALAAITATIAASYLGVSGTVIGAALASVVSAVGNAVYGHSLRSTRDRVRVVVPPRSRRGAPSAPELFPPLGRATAGPTAPRQEIRTEERPPRLPAARPRPPRAAVAPAGRPTLWRAVAIGAMSVFAAVLAIVTGVEVVAGRPLADIVRGVSGSGTSVFGSGGGTGGAGTAPSPTVTKTVVPDVVITTPTVTRTAPAVTRTAGPTTAPSTSPSTGGPTTGSTAPTSIPTAP